jgi:transketolase
MTTETQPLDQLCVNTIRTLSMDAVERAKAGHPGTPMALAPLAYVLYTKILRHNPANAEWPDRDRFVLSCGHASMLLYSTLYLTGYGVTLEDLKSFRQLGSRCAGHPELGLLPGVETTTGPLGQGIGNSVGLALAERMLAARFNTDEHNIVDHRTFAIVSDGDMQEGVSSEACSLAGHLGLGRLVVFYDDNHISIEGETELAFSEDVAKRFEAYGWHVQHAGENPSIQTLETATNNALQDTQRPSLVILRTHIAQGSPNLQDSALAHGAALGEEEVRLTKSRYGWPTDEHFHVPEQVIEHCREAIERGRGLESEWHERAQRYREAYPDLWEEFELIVGPRAPQTRPIAYPSFAGEDKVATRKASHKVLQAAAESLPYVVGGSADLGTSVLSLIDASDDIRAGEYGGRNLRFGIREHGMGTIVNGLTLHGFRAYGSTFLIFSDYMRPSIRLAALMGLPSIFLFSHDSIGLGEDGPTHQPVEQLVSLRAIPGLSVIRPADANETRLAWEYILGQTTHPCALVMTRQKVPVLDPEEVVPDAIERGAYVLAEASTAEPDLILMATGSEVHPCLEAAETLESEGIATRVVSMPCIERFAEQDRSYRDNVLPPACNARVAVEAASPLGWDRWLGPEGESVAMHGFGASAPANDLFEHFGFAATDIAAKGRLVVARLEGAKSS